MVNTSDILPNTPRYLKVPLIFFNSILWILGLILIIIGAWALKQLKHVDGLNINVTLPAGLVVLGVFIIILTALGCFVAFKEHLVGLIAYTLIILILLICLIGVGGAAFSYRHDADSLLTKAWNKTDPTLLAPIERYFDCCGWSGLPNTSYANTTLKDGHTVCLLPDVVDVPPSTTTGMVDTTTTGEKTTGEASTGEATTAETTTGEATTGEATTGEATTGERKKRAVLAVRSFFEASSSTGAAGATMVVWTPNFNATNCHTKLVGYVNDKMYVAGVAGVVIGVIEFVCMLFSLFLIVRLCRNPRSSRAYETQS